MAGVIIYPVTQLEVPNIGTDNGNVSITSGTATWQQVIATTTYNSIYLLVEIAFNIANAGNGTNGTLDIGVGAAAAEIEKISNIALDSGPSGGTLAYNPITLTLPFEVAAGSRISARMADSGTGGSCRVAIQVLGRT